MKFKNVQIVCMIIVLITIIPIHAFMGNWINNKIFHTDATPKIDGHYEPMVYITPSGKRYHNFDCSYIFEIEPIGLFQAE